MSNPPQNHHRKSIRLKNYDYTQPGAYFITIVIHQREPLYGSVIGENVQLTNLDQVITREWLKLPKRIPTIQTDAFVLMPNHLHGSINITEPCKDKGISRINQSQGIIPRVPTTEWFGSPIAGSVPTIIRSFKSSTTLRYRLQSGNPEIPLWQRNYYEHIVRDEVDLNRIREYINNNPLNWMLDQE